MNLPEKSNTVNNQSKNPQGKKYPSDADVRQRSEYTPEDKAAPDNNIFWENEHNPLSSKGD